MLYKLLDGTRYKMCLLYIDHWYSLYVDDIEIELPFTDLFNTYSHKNVPDENFILQRKQNLYRLGDPHCDRNHYQGIIKPADKSFMSTYYSGGIQHKKCLIGFYYLTLNQIKEILEYEPPKGKPYYGRKWKVFEIAIAAGRVKEGLAGHPGEKFRFDDARSTEHCIKLTLDNYKLQLDPDEPFDPTYNYNDDPMFGIPETSIPEEFIQEEPVKNETISDEKVEDKPTDTSTIKEDKNKKK